MLHEPNNYMVTETIKTSVGTAEREDSLASLFARFSTEAANQEAVKRVLANRGEGCGVAVFEHLDLGVVCRRGPGTAYLIFGPGCTYTGIEQLASAPLGETPSAFKYLVAFWRPV